MDEYIKREDAIRNVASVTARYAEDSAMKSLCLNALLATTNADVVPKSECVEYEYKFCHIVGNAKVYTKTAFNALSDEELLNELKSYKKKQIIIFGIETHICVHQTVAALINYGFNVTVISDACGSRSEYEYQLGLKNMNQNGAKIKTTEMILFELIKGAKHPNFKEIQALIK